MLSPKIAIILYTVREPAKENLGDTLKRVRDTGFQYVQWSGMPSLPADEIRAALDDADLEAVAAHCGIEPFEQDFEGQVAFWKTVGCKDVAPGGMMKECWDTLEGWLDGARRLNELGAKLRGEGMRLSYHNHDREFQRFEDDPRCKLDILYEETEPENLKAELDTCWVYVAGADPVTYIRKYAGRCPVIHVKDRAPESAIAEGKAPFTPLGQGVLNWEEIFVAARESEVEWCVYEQDQYDGDVFDAVKTSYEFLQKHLG